jgi:hypothetical protein
LKLLHELEACAVGGAWTQRDAAAWWLALDKGVPQGEQAVSKREQLDDKPGTANPDMTAAYQ